MKVKRRVVEERCRTVIDALYAEGDEGKLRQFGYSSPRSDSLTI